MLWWTALMCACVLSNAIHIKAKKFESTDLLRWLTDGVPEVVHAMRKNMNVTYWKELLGVEHTDPDEHEAWTHDFWEAKNTPALKAMQI